MLKSTEKAKPEVCISLFLKLDVYLATWSCQRKKIILNTTQEKKNGIMHINIIKKTLEFDIHTHTHTGTQEEALNEFSNRFFT